jgi:hypothetical protein
MGGIGGYYNGDQSLIFDCYNTFTLHSVKMYSPIAQNIIVELRNSSGATLQTATVSVVAGMNVVTLDMTIPPGNDYSLTRASGDLFRNNNATTNVGYPFNIDNFCSIKSSTAGDEYYYFFYDWNVKLPDHACSSPRVPVQAVVLAPNAISGVQVLGSLSVYPNPANSSLNISFKTEDNTCLIELIDGLGKTVLIKNSNALNGTIKESIDVASLPRGIYNIHILSDGKNYYHQAVLN